MFEIWQEADGTVKVSGRLDAAMAERAKEVFAGVTEDCKVDLSALDYISSAGIGILIATQKRLSENASISGSSSALRGSTTSSKSWTADSGPTFRGMSCIHDGHG